jgi:hypothetical protein
MALPTVGRNSADFIFQQDGAPRITITTFGATWMTDCHNDGSAMQLRGIKNWCFGHHIPQISPHVISSCGVLSRIMFLYHHFQRHWLTCARTSQQPSQWLTTTCYEEFGRNLITGLMCVVLRVEHMLSICNVPERNFVSFPFHQSNYVYLWYIKLE